MFGVIAVLSALVLLANEGPQSPRSRTQDLGSPAPATTAYGHVEALQEFADEYGDRAAGTPGYEAAAQYVEGLASV